MSWEKGLCCKRRNKETTKSTTGHCRNLHTTFQMEYQCTESRTSFFRARPFWLTFRKPSDRKPCLCQKHSNMEHLIRALKNSKVIQNRSIKEVLESSVCSPDREECMMNRCQECKEKSVKFFYENYFSLKYQK